MIKVDNLYFSYEKKTILKRINFQVKKGQLTCLLGANGSGKTTIIKCLNRILQPEEGQIELEGVSLYDLSQKEIAQKVSLVPQEHSAVFSYQSIEVVAMGITPYLTLGTQPSSEVYDKAGEIMEQLNISELAYRNYNHLSGGERQLVLIARALLQDTPYLLMDEPTSHLDFKNQHLILQELKRLTQEGAGVVTALHDPNLAMKFCDRVIIVKEGEILAQGNTEETMTNQNLGRAYDIAIEVDRDKGVEIAL